MYNSPLILHLFFLPSPLKPPATTVTVAYGRAKDAAPIVLAMHADGRCSEHEVSVRGWWRLCLLIFLSYLSFPTLAICGLCFLPIAAQGSHGSH